MTSFAYFETPLFVVGILMLLSTWSDVGVHGYPIHARHATSTSSRFQLTMGGGVVRGDRLPALLKLIEGTQKGLQTGNKAAIIDLIDDIADANKQFVEKKEYLDRNVNGRWELLWTTEKETLFFVQRGLFGKKVTSIYQNIDLNNQTINNLIEFEGDRKFSVLGDISKDATTPSRINFSFSSAEISVPPFPTLRIPPVGKGWFDNVYSNGKYRLSRDVRGDYLVSVKN